MQSSESFDGLPIAFGEAGEEPPAVCLHGYLGNRSPRESCGARRLGHSENVAHAGTWPGTALYGLTGT